MSIDVRHLTKQYGRQVAVSDISFGVQQGEILGFLGPNGAGKSTTMKMITGYIAPDAGEILVRDLPVSPEQVQARRHIGYLPENNPLYGEMFVREYLHYVAGLYGLRRPAGRIEEVIRLTGLLPEAHKIIRTLSKGYRQRVGLAQAIVHDPDVLVLDEPTSGLDPNQVLEIRTLIKTLGKTKTILLSTHIMQEVQALCDRVVILDKGRILANGPIAALSREFSGAYSVTVKFSESVPQDSWPAVAGYLHHREVAPMQYLVTGSDPELNAQLFDMAVRRGIRILEMTARQESMEQIFHQLTSGKR